MNAIIENEAALEVTQTPIKFLPTSAPEEVIPAPVTPETIIISKYDTQVTFDVILYLDQYYDASKIKECKETILPKISVSEKTIGRREIIIPYYYATQPKPLLKANIFTLTLSNIGIEVDQLYVTLYLRDLDPVTSRGTTTTIKREM